MVNTMENLKITIIQQDIYWEDREFFHFTYKADQTDLKGLVKQIDKKVIELSKLY